MISFIIIVVSFILFTITFFNKSFYIGLGENYLKLEIKNRIEVLSDKIDYGISKDTKVGKVLDKFKLSNKVNTFKNKIKEKTLIKTDKIVNEIFNGEINNMKDIKIFGKSVKNYVKLIINNFILDIRIFFITNFIGFLMIYLLMFYKSRKDIIKNMFYIIIISFLVMVGGLFYYIIGQDWITNIVTNNFIGYIYPFIILTFILFFLYFFRKTDENKNLLNNNKIGKTTTYNKVETTISIIGFIIEIIISIIFIPFEL